MSIPLEVKVEACSKYTLIHEWSVYETTCADYLGDEIALPSSVVTNTPLLSIPTNTLQYGKHCVKFRTQYSRTVIRSEVRIQLNIRPSDLQAIIEGGSERSMAINEKNVLDGTQSYDPDDNVVELFYSWTCTAVKVVVIVFIEYFKNNKCIVVRVIVNSILE